MRQGTENLQLRWQVSQQSAELPVIKLASAEIHLEGVSALSALSAFDPLNWIDLTPGILPSQVAASRQGELHHTSIVIILQSCQEPGPLEAPKSP